MDIGDASAANARRKPRPLAALRAFDRGRARLLNPPRHLVAAPPANPQWRRPRLRASPASRHSQALTPAGLSHARRPSGGNFSALSIRGTFGNSPRCQVAATAHCRRIPMLAVAETISVPAMRALRPAQVQCGTRWWCRARMSALPRRRLGQRRCQLARCTPHAPQLYDKARLGGARLGRPRPAPSLSPSPRPKRPACATLDSQRQALLEGGGRRQRRSRQAPLQQDAGEGSRSKPVCPGTLVAEAREAAQRPVIRGAGGQQPHSAERPSAVRPQVGRVGARFAGTDVCAFSPPPRPPVNDDRRRPR